MRSSGINFKIEACGDQTKSAGDQERRIPVEIRDGPGYDDGRERSADIAQCVHDSGDGTGKITTDVERHGPGEIPTVHSRPKKASE